MPDLAEVHTGEEGKEAKKGEKKNSSAESKGEVKSGQTFQLTEFLINPSIKGSREVDFGTELTNEHAAFLENYLTRLSDLAKTEIPNSLDPTRGSGRTYYDLLRSDYHTTDRKLFELLGSPIIDSSNSNQIIGYKPDQNKIREFLKDPKGWKLTMKLMEQDIARRLFALGMQVVSNPELRRNEVVQNENIHLGVDQGVLNKVWHDKIEPNLGSIGKVIGRAGITGAGGGIGALIGSKVLPLAFPWSAAAGGAAGVGVVGLGAAINSLRKKGLTISLESCVNGFESLAHRDTDPVDVQQHKAIERQFIKQMTGLDMDDFGIAGGTLRRVRGRDAESVVSPENLKNQTVEYLLTRFQTLQKLGIPPKDIAALPEQYLQGGTAYTRRRRGGLFGRSETSIQQLSTKMDEEVLTWFNRLGGDAGDLIVNKERWEQARERSMVDDLTEMAIDVLNKEEISRDDVIKQKIADREAGGKVYEAEKKKLQTQKEDLMKEGGILADEEKQFDEYDKAQAAVDAAIRKLSAHPYMVAGGRAGIAAAIATREALNQPAALDAERAAARTDNDTRRDTTLHNLGLDVAPPLGTPDSVITARAETTKSIIDMYKGLLNDRLAEINQLAKDRAKEITDIQQIQLEIEEKEREMHKVGANVNGDRQMNNMGRQFTEITGWAVAANPAVQLDLAHLASENVNQILARINEAHNLDPNVGWSQGDNNTAAHRLLVINLMNEAKARREEATRPAAVRTAREDALRDLTGFGVSQRMLRTRDATELNDMMVAEGRWPAPGPDPRLALAIDEARSRHQARLRNRRELVQDEVNEVKELAANMSEEPQISKDELDVLKLSLNLGGKFEKARIACQDSEIHPEKYFDNNGVINADDPRLSASEKANPAYTYGYLEVMNMLFQYRGENTNESFRLLSRTLTPDVLCDLLDNFVLSHPRGFRTPPNLTATLTEVYTALNNHVISSYDFAQASASIIKEIRELADPL